MQQQQCWHHPHHHHRCHHRHHPITITITTMAFYDGDDMWENPPGVVCRYVFLIMNIVFQYFSADFSTCQQNPVGDLPQISKFII